MRLLSWTTFPLVLCTTCRAGAFSDPQSHYPQLLERQRNRNDDDEEEEEVEEVEEQEQQQEEEEEEEEEEEDDEPRRGATTTARRSSSRETSNPPRTSTITRTSATTRLTPASTTRDQSTRTTSTSSSPTSAPSLTSTSSFSTSTPLPTTSITSLTSSTSSADASEATSILALQPQSSGGVNTGGVIAGVVLGAAVLIGILWIAIAKWRESKQQRAHFRDEESKSGFAGGAAARGRYTSSQDSLVAGGKLARTSTALRLKALSHSSRAYSFVSSLHDSPRSPMAQDVMPSLSPAQNKGLPQLPLAEPQFSTALGSHPNITQMPSSHGPIAPAPLQAGRPVQRKPLPAINLSQPVDIQQNPSAHRHSPPAELPG